MRTEKRIRLTVDDVIARLSIDRPAKRNALDADMIDALATRCREIEQSCARVVILTGCGNAFCAGGDIAAWSKLPPDSFGRYWVRYGHTAFDALARLRQPVIAALNGHALGGGLELAACADFRIAERHIKVGLPETGLGIIPGWSGTQRALRRFGAQVVRRMVLLGEVFTADEARVVGIVDRVVSTGDGLHAAEEAAEQIIARSPRATELAKLMLAAAEGEESERVLESLAGALAAGSTDLREGIAAFQEKRTARFDH